MVSSRLWSVHGIQHGGETQGPGFIVMASPGGGNKMFLSTWPCSCRGRSTDTAPSLWPARGEPLAVYRPLLFLFLLAPVPHLCFSPWLNLLKDQVGLVGISCPSATGRDLGSLSSCLWVHVLGYGRAPRIAAQSFSPPPLRPLLVLCSNCLLPSFSFPPGLASSRMGTGFYLFISSPVSSTGFDSSQGKLYPWNGLRKRIRSRQCRCHFLWMFRTWISCHGAGLFPHVSSFHAINSHSCFWLPRIKWYQILTILRPHCFESFKKEVREADGEEVGWNVDLAQGERKTNKQKNTHTEEQARMVCKCLLRVLVCGALAVFQWRVLPAWVSCRLQSVQY